VTKQDVRERIWAALQEEGAARFPGAQGRIPNFTGAEAAAALLAEQPEWRDAATIKSNPDSPQLPVRRRAVRDGRDLYMAVPRLREEKPFLLVLSDPTIRRAGDEGIPTALGEMPPVDLVVCGTVAVNRDGVRIGKGGGYSDLELALLIEEGRITERTVIATTVHAVQLVDDELPETEHDFRVDLIVTPDAVIRTPGGNRPPGVLWDHLDPEKVEAIPVLQSRQP
jgi:5-formyltetrahydrofolate cyclo-ligase